MLYFRPVYGLVFLFKWLPGDHNNQGSVVMDSRRTEIFFAKQVSHVTQFQASVYHMTSGDHQCLCYASHTQHTPEL